MTEEPEITRDDKLWAALSYPIPIVALLVLLMEEKKGVPFLKFHAVQAIALNLVLWVLILVLSVTIVLAICAPALWLVTLWPAYDAYQGRYTEIPVLTKFLKGQGWV